jgi:outer membrane protein TolC
MTWRFAGLLLLELALAAVSGCGGAARDRPNLSVFSTMLLSTSERQAGGPENVIGASKPSNAAPAAHPSSRSSTAVGAIESMRDLPLSIEMNSRTVIPAKLSVPPGDGDNSVLLTAASQSSQSDSARSTDLPRVVRTSPPIVATSIGTASTEAGAACLVPNAVWWNDRVGMALRDPERAVRIDLERLAYEALVYSDQIKALRTVPLSVAKEICIADSEFDAKTFVESKFRDLSDPVSDTLTTGGPPRLNEHRWAFDAGVRQKLASGATASISQQLGHTNSNSLFFVPNNQGAARLALNLTQPLLRGAGTEYNRSLIVLAELDTRVANDDLNRELQRHLLDICEAYWALYAERAGLVQRQWSLELVARLAKELEARKIMDATPSQVIHVRAAIARRKADLVRNYATIRNTEALLYRLTNSPALVEGAEVVPEELPVLVPPQVDARLAVEQALRHRPEVDAAFYEVRAAKVRLNVSEHDLFPYLNAVVETYVSGLEGQSDVGTAWREQFDEGAPSYTAGLTFEMPLGNHGARARYAQRRLALAQVTFALRSTLTTVASEVDIAVREVQTLYEEVAAKMQSVVATLAEVNHLEARWRLLARDEGVASLALEDLLQAHERLLGEELSLAQSMAAYSIAGLELRRATGTLLDVDEPVVPSGWSNGPAVPEEIPVPESARTTSRVAATSAMRFGRGHRLTSSRSTSGSSFRARR